MRNIIALLEQIDADVFNAKLAKLFQKLKKDAKASSIKQSYKGTGSRKHRRQLWINFESEAVIDIWLEQDSVVFGGVVARGGGNLSKTHVAYGDRTPEQVYAEAMPILRDWANSKQEDSSPGTISRLVERIQARHLQLEGTSAEATFKKLKDGTWGLLVNSDQVKSGDNVLTVTKAGKQSHKIIDKVIWSGQGVSICTIADGGRSAGVASEAQIDLASRLLRRLGKSGWHDSDLGQGQPFPKSSDLHNMSSKEISDFISSLRSEL